MCDIYEAIWSGHYPTLCWGEWKLYKNNREVLTEIPFKYSDAVTFGEYSYWSLNNDYEEVVEEYEDGLPEREWIASNSSWLETVAPEKDWPLIYSAFTANNFRKGEYGGCI